MTITKERLLKIQHWRETYGADSNVMLPAEEAEELARIALASLEVAPVGEVSEKRHGLVMDGTVDLGGKSTYRIIKGEKAMKRLPLGTKFYIAPPAPVVDADPVVFTDERNLHHIARGRETSLIWGKQNQEVGDIPLYRHAQPAPVVHQIMRELVSLLDEDQFARIENIALSAGVMPPQPAPVVPEEIPKGLAGQIVSLLAHNIGDKFLAQKIWSACRAAMLKGKGE
ncbi:TPA: Eaa protein [Salmonella enterica]|nr:Eaa protein [Salmonella enterica]HCL4864170.1 Eaa protein [Salmonella enterica]